MIKNLVVKGAREHNLKNIDIEITKATQEQIDALSFLQGFQVQANQALPLTLFMQRDSADMLKAFPLMQGSF